MKKLLLLGGSRFLLPVIREAKSLSCHTITCDYLPDNIAHRFSDEYHNVSIIDREAVLALARELQIDGIMSFGCDPGVVTAAFVAEQMGLPNVAPYESVAIVQDKGRFRAFLREHGFTVPASRVFAAKADALSADGFRYPVIVKPVDSAGSKGVSRVDAPEGLDAAYDNAEAHSLCGRVIVEEFIEQQGFASDTESFSVDGELRFVSFNNQYFDKQAANPYTPAGFTWPSTMPAAIQAELKQELQRLLRLLHMGTAVYNIECRMGTDGRAYLMEVSPRGGGNRLCEMLHYTTGQNLIRCAVQAALGLPFEAPRQPEYSGHWSYVALHSYVSGRFAGLKLAEEVKPYLVEEDLWVQPGDQIEAFSGANKTIGTLVLNWPTEAMRDRCMADIPAWLSILTEEA